MFKKISIFVVLVALNLVFNQPATAGKTVEDF